MKIIFIIDRFEGEEAILKTEDGKETVAFPRRLLPAANEGAMINFDLKTLKEAEEEKRKKAKDVLNEILNLEEESPDN
ncbi:MAG: DUF3006 family protein [Patescibacteria group bacterium]|jgi:hypothetical protein